MACVFIGIGSNLGDRQENIAKALESLKQTAGITIKKVSSIIETKPWAGPSQGKYLNAVIEIDTQIEPKELLKITQQIEHDLGRVREVINGPRTIDLDILLYDDVIMDSSDLIIPHPRMWERDFVMRPLTEIAPDIAKRANFYDHRQKH